ncbi:MAG TPA: tetratricopeptide repeat protein, partial [Pseudonocardiaceae bacterium]|nr:tetratricopeptide repeat protein [Pseudonocardiaceae bacterium]
AFARDVPVIPVLLDGSRLPDPDALPGDIRQLTHCQTVEVRHRSLGADVQRLADAVGDLLAVPDSCVDTGYRWRRVRECDDPVLLGVHPSPIRAAPAVDLAPKVPAYVPREAADCVAWALTATSFVLIVGDATAGKTRLAYETVRKLLPDHWLVVPDWSIDLPDIAAQTRHARNRVVWLDDIERYFGPNGLTADLVTTLTRPASGHTVLVGTIRSREHAQLSPRWERHAEEPGQLRSRLGRDVVRLAYEIHLDRRWSAAEIRRAANSTDPRVTEAARHADEYGVAEYLAAGPQLLAEWRDAWSPGNHPRAAALVAAAVDVHRAGVRGGVGVDLLHLLHDSYLEARGGMALRPESFDAALAWATETLHATSSLLMPIGPDRHQPFAYLIDAVDTDPQQSVIPDNTWRVLVDRVQAPDCWHIGEAAYARRNLAVARSAFERAAMAGNAAAELKVADCVGESGRRADAVTALQGVVRTRTRSHGDRHPDTLEARQALAGWTARAGDLRGAIGLLTELTDDLDAAVGPEHLDTLTARHALAAWTARAGRLADAIIDMRRLVSDQSRWLGPDHPHTLATRHELANWLGRADRLDEAVREHEQVIAAQTGVLGGDHPDTLRSRHRLARLICQVRGTDTGLPLLADVVTDQVRVLGRDHPHTLRSRWQYVRWL